MFIRFMQYVLMQIPTWLKILGLLLLLSVVFSVLGAVSEFLIPSVFLIALILFPGKDPDRPRLIKIIPWLWALGLVLSLAILISDYMGKEILSPEARSKQTSQELWATIVLTPLLLWSFWKQKLILFRLILISGLVIMFGLDIWVFLESSRVFKDVLDLIGGLTAELILAVYLLLKFKAPEKKRELAHQ